MRATFVCLVILGWLAAVGAEPVPKETPPPPITEKHIKDSQKNLKEIGLAFHNFHDTKNFLPGDIRDKNGKPLLSWRVAILPYLGEDALFKQFKLDEPWDSQHNLKLVEKMPKIYAPIRVKANPGETFYQGFAGAKTVFDLKAKRLTLRAISNQNGISNTILVVESGVPTVWTVPGGLPREENKPLPKLGGVFNGDFHVLFCDGAVRYLKSTTDEDELKKSLDPNNNVPINLNKSLK